LYESCIVGDANLNPLWMYKHGCYMCIPNQRGLIDAYFALRLFVWGNIFGHGWPLESGFLSSQSAAKSHASLPSPISRDPLEIYGALLQSMESLYNLSKSFWKIETVHLTKCIIELINRIQLPFILSAFGKEICSMMLTSK
jgi:hypothetical protein